MSEIASAFPFEHPEQRVRCAEAFLGESVQLREDAGPPLAQQRTLAVGRLAEGVDGGLQIEREEVRIVLRRVRAQRRHSFLLA